MRRPLPRPRRAGGPVAASVLTLVAWSAVAHNSGSGWVQALGAVLAGFLFIGLVAPAVVVGRAHGELLSAPSDATAGRPCAVLVAVSTALELRPSWPPGEVALTGRADGVTLTVVPTRRGTVTRCRITMASAAPFGLLWWTRELDLVLPRPLLVAPAIGAPDVRLLADQRVRGEDEQRRDARVGEPRGVRAYRAGDLRHWVHWPATAHTGVLMVREMEAPAARPVVLDVVLPPDPDEADRLAERVLGTVAELLGQGKAVQLGTIESGGPRSAVVVDLVDAGRRLARALPVSGPPPGMEDR